MEILGPLVLGTCDMASPLTLSPRKRPTGLMETDGDP
jgi:hypothetical protein